MSTAVIQAEGLGKQYRHGLVIDGRVGAVRLCVWAVAIGVGFLEAWAARFLLIPDSTNYLDIASAYLRRDWNVALNAYWSPLFSWLLALVLKVFHPSPYWESTAFRLLNFGGFLAALGCFEYFFRNFLDWQKNSRDEAEANDTGEALREWILGYAIFLSTSAFILGLATATPDIWVSALTYVIAGHVMRISMTGGNWVLFSGFGLALGLAYLTKTFYLPMGYVFLVAMWHGTGDRRLALKWVTLSFLMFATVSGTWIAVLSQDKGRFTYGDVGKIAFAMTIDRLPQQTFWRGEGNTGIPKHPVLQTLDQPHVFDYSSHAAGTYPPWFARAYWMEGVDPHFSVKGELLVLRQSLGTVFQMVMAQAEFLVGALFLAVCVSRKRWRDLAWGMRMLWVPATVACLAYSVVLLEGRYVAPFVLLLWIVAFFSLLPAVKISPRFLNALVLSMASVCALRVAKVAETDLVSIAPVRVNMDWEVAQALWQLGARPGDRIARIGLDAEAHWARLAGVTCVAEVPFGEGLTFWEASDARKRLIFEKLAASGAKFVVAKITWPDKAGWSRLGESTLYAHSLPESR